MFNVENLFIFVNFKETIIIWSLIRMNQFKFGENIFCLYISKRKPFEKFLIIFNLNMKKLRSVCFKKNNKFNSMPTSSYYIRAKSWIFEKHFQVSVFAQVKWVFFLITFQVKKKNIFAQFEKNCIIFIQILVLQG